jgi:F-type H+-transporting ATPase subunit a
MSAPVLASGVVEHLTNSREIEFGPIFTIHLEPVNGWFRKAVGVDPHLSKHAVMMMLAAAIVAVAAIYTSRRAVREQGHGRFAHMVEATALFLRDQVVKPGIGDHHARAWFPWMATLFFFILTCNLLGLLPPPLGATATGNIWVTAGLASLTLGAMLFGGMAEKGPLRYWASIVPHGVPWWMWPIVWPIELFGHFTKPFALTVRLFANMTAGHVILAVLGGMFLVAGSQGYWTDKASLGQLLGLKAMVVVPSLAFALFIVTFELLVAFVQAYIFTTLSSIFIGLCLSHEH